MVKSVWREVEKILPNVEKPSRYINREWGSVHKSHSEVAMKIALAYPDTYEVGVSNLGLQILYEILNERSDVVAERVYAPWIDMEKEMRAAQIPLFSLESHLPISSFDIVGFSLQTEMTYTNVLNMLDLSGIPLKSSERSESDPIIIAGGPCVFNPEPVAPFFDLFVIGEGEEVISEIVDTYQGLKTSGGQARASILKELATISGVYVPDFYEPRYDKEGKVVSIDPKANGISEKVLKRAVKDLDQFALPEKFIVPFMNVIHDRCSLEIMRGCTRGCRFCHAGVIYRPTRERSSTVIEQLAGDVIKETGYEEISLASLSSTDHSSIEPLVSSLAESYENQGVAISLP